MSVSVITTFKNEQRAIAPFLEGLLAQSRRPDEIIMVDGGSTDHSIDKVQRFIQQGAPVKVLLFPGNRAVGRNAAIQEARFELIASSDVGSVPDKDWLRSLVAALEKNPDIGVASGVTLPKAENLFEECVATINLPDPKEINPEYFLPSSRSMAFRKTVWERAGGYPEWLSWNEDTLFNFSLRKAGAQFKFVPDAVVYWQPPGNIYHLFRQFYYYARGDGQAGIYLWEFYLPKKFLLYGAGLVLLIFGFMSSWAWLALLAGMVLYFQGPGKRVFQKVKSIGVLMLMPQVMIARDVAEMFGYFMGTLDRWFNPKYFRRPWFDGKKAIND